jgi:peptide/nickel transport system substrate-binding protein
MSWSNRGWRRHLRPALLLGAGLLWWHAAPAQSPDHFVAAMLDEPEALDMTVVRYRPPSSAVLRNVEEMLWGFRPDGSVIPTVADWQVSPDGKTIVFKIHPGIRFHSGDELTAADVVFSVARVTAHAPSLKRHTRFIDKVEALDRYTVRFDFNAPDVNFLEGAEFFLASKAYYDRVGEKAFVDHPSGIGPYRVVDYKQGQFLGLAAFDGYYGKKPKVRAARVYFVKDDETRVNRLKSGEADLIMDAPYTDVAALQRAGFRIAKLPANPTVAIDFDLLNPNVPWHDRRVRLAIAMAIDGDAIVKKLFQGVPERYPRLAPGEEGYDPALRPYPYDPAAAKRLLAAAGYANGFDMPLYYLTGSFYGFRETAEAVALYLQAVGIRCSVRAQDVADQMGMARRMQTDPNGVYVAIGSQPLANSGLPPLEMLTISYLSSAGMVLYKNPAIDALIHRAMGELDPAERDRDVAATMRLVQDDVATIPIWDTVTVFAMKPDVHYTPIEHRMPHLALRDVTIGP